MLSAPQIVAVVKHMHGALIVRDRHGNVTPRRNRENVMSFARVLGSRLARDERGTEVIEYALLLGMLICASIVLISALGSKVVARWTRVNEMF